MKTTENRPQPCATCNRTLGHDDSNPDGWRLDDGRVVCTSCMGDRYADVIRKLELRFSRDSADKAASAVILGEVQSS